MLICQVAKEKYLVRADHRPRQQPAQPPALQAAGHPAGGLGDRPDPAPDRARGAASTGSCTCSTWRRSGSRSSSWRCRRRAGGRPRGQRHRAARRLPDHLGAARRRRLRAEGATPSSRPATRCCSSSTPGSSRTSPPQFTRNGASTADGGRRADVDVPADRRRPGRAPTARAGCASRASRERSCSSAASPTRPTTGRRARRATCRARSRARTRCFRPDEWWEEQRIDLRTRTSVMKLDPAAQGGDAVDARRSVSYDKALLATGANVRRLNVEGAELEGIHYLRTLRQRGRDPRGREDAEHVVLIGGSYIGSEVAASLTLLGKQVHDGDAGGRSMLRARRSAPRPGATSRSGSSEHGVDRDRRGRARPLRGRRRARHRTSSRQGRALARVPTRWSSAPAPCPTSCSRAAAGLRARRPRRGAGDARGCESSPTCGYAPATSRSTTASSTAAHAHRALGRRLQPGQDGGAEHARPRAAQHDVVPYFFSDLADWASLEYVGPAREWDERDRARLARRRRVRVWYL